MEKDNSGKKKFVIIENQPPEREPKREFEDMVEYYLNSNPILKTDGKIAELEVRFGISTHKDKPLSKINYDNVVQVLFANGFKTENPEGIYSLRIMNEYMNKEGGVSMSNIRTEINGIDLIQEYCKTNNLQKLLDMPSMKSEKIHFTQKLPATNPNTKMILKSVVFDDYNFRVSYQLENVFSPHSNFIRDSIISKWMDSKKIFRHLNRVRLHHDKYPIFADITILKGSTTITTSGGKKVPIPQYTLQDAKVFENPETYEIELEVDNSRVGVGTDFNTKEKLLQAMRHCIRLILSGIQETNYPIGYKERDDVTNAYLKMIHGDQIPKRNRSAYFIGPSSITLQLHNIIASTEVSTKPNIRKDYCVTDKADGERSLLYISKEGKLYLMDTNMSIKFTGYKTEEKKWFESLLDGEHIKYDKNQNYVNLYAVFDIYYIAKKSVRELPFQYPDDPSLTTDPEKRPADRFTFLKKCLNELNAKPIQASDSNCIFRIRCKEFEFTTRTNSDIVLDTDPNSIFECCGRLLRKIKDGCYPYNTDGLIFTPVNIGVGFNGDERTPLPVFKSTWNYSFKWKPVEFNTIDFLVSVQKNPKTGRDDIHSVFQDGIQTDGIQNLQQYKTIILRCGFNKETDGHLNPFQDMLDWNHLKEKRLIEEEEGQTYLPVPFMPTQPHDPNTCYGNINLITNGVGEQLMLCEDGDYFGENMIVEFAYDNTKSEGWRWKPLRVRYDKTAELRNGGKNYGNSYKVANNIWYSLHHPVTEEMMTTGKNIPEAIDDLNEEEKIAGEGVYYNRDRNEQGEGYTQRLRDFHNLYVKRKLIMSVAQRRDTLIDYAVGKAGDLPKWNMAFLSFILGIDISEDNIMNKLDGACSRYLDMRLKYKKYPDCIFLRGNSALNIRQTGEAFSTEKEKKIVNVLFGNATRDEASKLGSSVAKNYAVAETGFQISSCQFALHYFFENKTKLYNFLQNLEECTKVNGYFIGTCYDGKTVFQKLQNKEVGQGIVHMDNEHKIFELTRQYHETGMADDETCLGYPIHVYQESINRTFQEYLVNFDFFKNVMEDYGFVLLTDEEAKNIGMPSGTGDFRALYTMMMEESKEKKIQNMYRTAPFMKPYEKEISFLNRYFIFKKIRHVDSKKISTILKHRIVEADDATEEPAKETAEKEESDSPPPKVIKLKRSKIVLQQKNVKQ